MFNSTVDYEDVDKYKGIVYYINNIIMFQVQHNNVIIGMVHDKTKR